MGIDVVRNSFIVRVYYSVFFLMWCAIISLMVCFFVVRNNLFVFVVRNNLFVFLGFKV